MNLINELGTPIDIRNWFDNRLGETLMENPATPSGSREPNRKGGMMPITPALSTAWNILPKKSGPEKTVPNDVEIRVATRWLSELKLYPNKGDQENARPACPAV